MILLKGLYVGHYSPIYREDEPRLYKTVGHCSPIYREDELLLYKTIVYK
jgi:hypothetical protein